MPLTELTLRNLKPAAKPYRVGDGGSLWIEVSPSGSKLWRWRYRFDSKEQTHSLGRYPSVSLATARKLRDEARELVKMGKHPGRERKAERQRQINLTDDTFEKFARNWLTKKHRAESEKYRQQCLARMEDHVFPKIGALRLSEITAPIVVKVIEVIGEGGTIETARRMGQLLKQIFRYGIHCGECEYNPAADLQGILPPTPEKHHASIHPKDLTRLLKAMAAYEPGSLTNFAMNLMALTFVRTTELIAARWEEIDWQREEWHIPKERMKMKRPHVVPLCQQAISVLKNLHEITGKKMYIFYSVRSKTKYLSNGTILAALDRMGYRGQMTGHGYRTLASTILNENKFDKDAIERQLSHEDEDKVRSAYNRAEYLLERKYFMQWWGNFLDEKRSATEDTSGTLLLTFAPAGVA